MPGSPQSSRRRTEYLLGGRRVKVLDLLRAELLLPGTTLTFRRRKDEALHRATVLASGDIKLDDGRTFRSLSRAAAAAAGVRALDGWYAWSVEGSSKLIDSLRQQLLDDVAKEAEEASAPSVTAAEVSLAHRHERLKAHRTEAEAGQPAEMTVRDLLELWGADTRGHRVSTRVETELANHGLTTVPHWQKVTLDSRVRLESLRQVEAQASAKGRPTDVDDEVGDVGRTVGNLPSALSGICSVKPTATMEEAVTLMLLNDFSQIAVLSGPRHLRGAVTWKSIAQARHANPDALLVDAIVPAEERDYDHELVDLIPTLYAADFVFVRDETKTYRGIVTAADVVMAYGDMAVPFFLIGEMDGLLRRIIAQTYELDQVSDLCNPDGVRKIGSFDDLTIGDYQQVLQNPERWMQLGWPLDRAVFCRRLDELREIRNEVMHFNADPISEAVKGRIRSFIRLLREYGE